MAFVRGCALSRRLVFSIFRAAGYVVRHPHSAVRERVSFSRRPPFSHFYVVVVTWFPTGAPSGRRRPHNHTRCATNTNKRRCSQRICALGEVSSETVYMCDADVSEVSEELKRTLLDPSMSREEKTARSKRSRAALPSPLTTVHSTNRQETHFR